MKQINIRLEDEFLKEVKLFALQKGLTMQALVTEALKSYTKEENYFPSEVDLIKETTGAHEALTETKPKPAPAPSYPEYEEIFGETPKTEQTTPTEYHIIRKTAKVGAPLKMMRQFFDEKMVSYTILDGCRPHFDEDGKQIPFRFTDWDGVVQEPDEEELETLAEAWGMPVKFEE